MTSRAVLYLRLSATDDASTSIVRQEADLRELAARNDWEVVRLLADDGVTGTKSRANAEEALRMLRDGEADVLAVWKFDRWSRQGLSAVASLIDTLDAVPSAQFMAYRDGLSSTQPAWRIIASVLAEVARMESDNTSTRAKSSHKYLAHNGRFSGGTVPFGYRTIPNPDGDGRILTPAAAEAAIVRELAERSLGGESLSSLMRDLNGRQVPTTTSKYRRAALRGEDPEGLPVGRWGVSVISTLLTSDYLLGRVRVNTKGADGKRTLGDVIRDEDGLPRQFFEPVLDVATMTRLRAHLLAPASGKPREPRRRAARLLSGVAYCAVCDSKLYVRTTNGRPVYGCSSPTNGRECPAPRVTATGLEDYVVGEYLRIVGSAPELARVETVSDPGTAEALVEVEEALRDATGALMADEADVPALLRKLEALKARRTELRAIPSTVAVQIVETGRTFAEAWHADERVEARRAHLLDAIDHVAVRPVGAVKTKAFDPSRVSIRWVEERDYDAA